MLQVKRREDVIKRLKMDYVNLQEINNKREEKVRTDSDVIECK